MLKLFNQCVQVVSKRGYKNYYVPLMMTLKKRKDKEEPVLRPRSAFVNWNYSAELFAFTKRLNEPLSEESIRTAFTHKSYVEQEEKSLKELSTQETSLNLSDNEKLIHLGQDVMDSYIKKYLRHSYPSLPDEGLLTIYEFLLKEDLLAYIAKNLGMGELVLSSDFPVEQKTLATTFMAIVGTIANDRGIEAAQNFVLDFVLTELSGKDIHSIWDIQNPFGMLKDILHKDGKSEPEPRLLREAGRNTIFAIYVVGLYVDKKLIGQGPGESLGVAQEMAALDALRKIFGTEENVTPLVFGKGGKQLNHEGFTEKRSTCVSSFSL